MLRKEYGKKLVECESYLYILVLNEMWVKWVSGGPITIYSKNECGLLFADEKEYSLRPIEDDPLSFLVCPN